jgi:hypothetical protein
MELNQDDVVTMDAHLSFSAGAIFKVGQLHRAIRNHLKEPLWMWVREKGVDCEVLQVEGGGWQKGKMYLRMEFIPDRPKLPEQTSSTVANEPESPLADLRSQLDT